MDTRTQTSLHDLLDRRIADGTVPGAVAVLASGTDIDTNTDIVAAGTMAVGGAPMPEDAIMRIGSMAKVITSVAALRLVEAGRLELDQSVEEWLPELADRQVLTTPTARLTDTVPAKRAITLRHLLTNTSGYGMITVDSPLQQAMSDNGTEAGWEQVPFGADEWLARMAELPLAFQPGEGWRYHHSYAVLGILLARVTARPLGDHLAEDLFEPLGMPDTALWLPKDKLDRLPAAYRHGPDGLVEIEPEGGGSYAGPPPFDVSHRELVSTAHDFLRLIRVLVDEGRIGEQPLISAEYVRGLTSDQVPAAAKQPDSFFPGFWDGMGWGFGVGVQTGGANRGRYGWSGGQGTDFFVDPDGTIGILLTQVELGESVQAMVEEFQALHQPRV